MCFYIFVILYVVSLFVLGDGVTSCCRCRCCNRGGQCDLQNGVLIGQFEAAALEDCTDDRCKAFHDQLRSLTCTSPKTTYFSKGFTTARSCVQARDDTFQTMLIIIISLVGLLVTAGLLVSIVCMCHKERKRRQELYRMQDEMRKKRIDKAKIAAAARIQAARDFDQRIPEQLEPYTRFDYGELGASTFVDTAHIAATPM
eukprot:Filipodium_phascolosomae@DN89_c0_g1_i2.p1